tara:strand:+ start:9828 stop:10391 length:564 start_codon:yes stop_codon:yes gene_type:complete
MKTIKLLSILFISSLVFTSCKDDDDPILVNEEEVITTMTATLTPTSGGTTIVLKTQDLDGDGPNAPVVTVSGNLAINTVYTGVMEVLNETESPAEDITEEVLEEALEHQFFFIPTSSIATVTYTDTDSDGNPIGVQFTLTTSDAGSGAITISLIHEPEKTEPGVSTGDITNAGGETDITATFSIVIE